jgi:hypothetical protein
MLLFLGCAVASSVPGELPAQIACYIAVVVMGIFPVHAATCLECQCQVFHALIELICILVALISITDGVVLDERLFPAGIWSVPAHVRLGVAARLLESTFGSEPTNDEVTLYFRKKKNPANIPPGNCASISKTTFILEDLHIPLIQRQINAGHSLLNHA